MRHEQSIDVDIRKIRREQIRWTLVIALYNSRPIRAAEELLLSTMQGIYADATREELRRELGYLEGFGFVEVTRLPDGKWFSSLTHRGVDLKEYNIESPSGIARPEPYHG